MKKVLVLMVLFLAFLLPQLSLAQDEAFQCPLIPMEGTVTVSYRDSSVSYPYQITGRDGSVLGSFYINKEACGFSGIIAEDVEGLSEPAIPFNYRANSVRTEFAVGSAYKADDMQDGSPLSAEGLFGQLFRSQQPRSLNMVFLISEQGGIIEEVLFFVPFTSFIPSEEATILFTERPPQE